MKKNLLVACIAMIGWLGLPGTSLKAAFVSTNDYQVQFNLVATTQASITSVTNSSTITETAKSARVRITSKDMLNLLHAEFGGPAFPAGAVLAYDSTTSGFVVTDKNGTPILDVSSNLSDGSYQFAISNVLSSTSFEIGRAVRNLTTGNTVTTATLYESDETIFYSDAAGNAFHFTGVLAGKFNGFETSTSDAYKTINVLITVTGGGIVFNPADGQYEECVITGTIILIGKNISISG